MKSLFCALLLMGTWIVVMNSCKGLKDSIIKTSTQIDSSLVKITEGFTEIKDEFVPMDTLVKNSIIAAIEGVADDRSKQNLDTLTAKFNKYLTDAIDSLHISRRGAEIMDSLKASLLNDDTKKEIASFFSTALDTAKVKLDTTIDDLISKLTSEENKKKLSELGSSLISDKLKDELKDAFNSVIGGLDFDTLEHKIMNELLTQRLKDTLRAIVNDPIDKVKETGDSLLDRVRKFAEYILLGILAVAGIIIYLVHRLRKKDRDARSVVTEGVRSIKESDPETYEKLTKHIKELATKKDVEPYLNKQLKRDGHL